MIHLYFLHRVDFSILHDPAKQFEILSNQNELFDVLICVYPKYFPSVSVFSVALIIVYAHENCFLSTVSLLLILNTNKTEKINTWWG